MRRFFSPDSVALTGSAVGLASLLAGWLTLKPNRLVAGTSLDLWESSGGAGPYLIAGLWLVCLAMSVVNLKRPRGAVLGTTANAILIMALVLVGAAGSRLLQGESSAARVSLGAGFWVNLVGAYMAVFAARRLLSEAGAWRHAVSWSAPAAFILLLFSGWFHDLSVMQEYSGYQQRFSQEMIQHVRLFGTSVIAGTLLGIPLGIWATRNKYAERPVLFTVGMVQTVPSLALFGLLIAPLSALSFAFPALRDFGIRGVGVTPAIIALVIYSLLPIVRNTYVGLRRVDPAAIDAALGMGMSRWQVFRRIEIPLAASLVLEGVRTASVQAVGLATVAALIGAGGLGWFVFRGIGQAAPDLILLGAIPVIVLALLVDALMRLAVRLGTPEGTRGAGR